MELPRQRRIALVLLDPGDTPEFGKDVPQGKTL
jgi:hypothetical protein